jgi:hypothetical protein
MVVVVLEQGVTHHLLPFLFSFHPKLFTKTKSDSSSLLQMSIFAQSGVVCLCMIARQGFAS